MSTMMGLDIETIEHLDFEFATPCEANTEGEYLDCDKPAEWYWTLACCGTMFLVCEYHHKEVLVFRENHPNMLVRCAVCSNHAHAKDFYLAHGRI